MATTKRSLILRGKKLKEFRLSLGFSLVNFGTMVGISAATLSRMENGGGYHPQKFIDLCTLIGVAPNDFLNTDLSLIPKNLILKRIGVRVRLVGMAKSEYLLKVQEAENFHGPAYFIRMAIKDGFLDEYRQVFELQNYILHEYGVQLVSSSITNALMRKRGIVYQLTGFGNYNQYKYVLKRRD